MNFIKTINFFTLFVIALIGLSACGSAAPDEEGADNSNNGVALDAPSISMSKASIAVIVKRSIASITVNSTGGKVDSYRISPAMSNGFIFDTTTGTISGTPREMEDVKSYSITATNKKGSDSATIDINVIKQSIVFNVLSSKLKINPEGTVAIYVDSAFNKDGSLHNLDMKPITNHLYTYLKDDYDFIFLITNNKEKPSAVGYSGAFLNVSNDIKGIGRDIKSNAADHGSASKLKGYMHFAKRDAILSGPTLHELAHNWANQFRKKKDSSFEGWNSSAHWFYTGFYGGKGQLGGYDGNTFKEEVGITDTHPNRRDNDKKIYSVGNYGGMANGGNRIPYNDVELYLMGMLEKNSVKDVLIADSGGSRNDQIEAMKLQGLVVDKDKEYFAAYSVKRRTLDEQLKKLGAPDRDPSFGNSQKEFRVLTVLIDTVEPKRYQINLIDAQMRSLALKNDDGNDSNYNFYEATQQKGSLKIDDLSKTTINDGSAQEFDDAIAEQTINFHGLNYKTVESQYTGRVWLDRNIGATKRCDSFDDEACYGDYFQWGRGVDGHEKVSSEISTTLVSDINNTDNKFIKTSAPNVDWLDSGVDDDSIKRVAIWSKTDGTSVCPVGFRVPIDDELNEETQKNVLKDSFKNNKDAAINFLSFPSAGYRLNGSGKLFDEGEQALIWTTSLPRAPSTTNRPRAMLLQEDHIVSFNAEQAYGGSVRCVKD